MTQGSFVKPSVAGVLEGKCSLLLGIALVVSIILAFFVNQAVAGRLVVEMSRRNGSGIRQVLYFWRTCRRLSTHSRKWSGPTRTSRCFANCKGYARIGVSFELLRLDDGQEFRKTWPGVWLVPPPTFRALEKIAAAIAKSKGLREQEEAKADNEKGIAGPTTKTDETIATRRQRRMVPRSPRPLRSKSHQAAIQSRTSRSLSAVPIKVMSSFKKSVRWMTPTILSPNFIQSRLFDLSCVKSLDAHAADAMPFRVLRVKMPYAETRQWRLWSYSILTAVGLATLPLSLFFIHWILNRLVIRPLRYLRDVSDEVSRGNSNASVGNRYDDEFYELSDAFNRMLRHLTETQVLAAQSQFGA